LKAPQKLLQKKKYNKFGVDPAVIVDSVFISLLYEKYGEQFLDHLKGLQHSFFMI
jgi:hypothetical protein